MLTRSKRNNIKINDEKEKADDLNVRNGEKIKINGRGRRRPKKIVMQQIEEIEDNDEQHGKINENKELENEVEEIEEIEDNDDDVNEVTRALESTRIHKNGFSFNSIFESMTEAQMDETILDQNMIFANNDYDDDSDDYDNEKEQSDDSFSNLNNQNLFYDEANLEIVIPNDDISLEVNAEIQFVETIRGSRKLIHGGYSYVRDRGNFEMTQWKCAYSKATIVNDKRKYIYCPGRCHLYNDRDIRIVTEHSSLFHLPDPVESECLVVNNKIKEMAKLTADKPRSIIKKAQVNLTDEAAARMKRYPAQVQMMNRIRSTAATYGPNPISISDIIVPIPLSITYNKEPFVWKDSGYGDKDRIIIFTTENNIKLLINNKNWFGDGTFEVAPLIYQQMYNFSASICGKILPMMYTLLPSKTEIN